MKICGKVVLDTGRWDAWWCDRNSQRVRGRSEAIRQQHILGLPIIAHAAISIHHPCLCLTLGIYSSFPIIFSTQIHVHRRYINVVIHLFFSTLSRPSHKAEPTFGPLCQPTHCPWLNSTLRGHTSFPRHPQVLPWSLPISAPFRYHPLPTCLSIDTRVCTHVNVLKHVHTYLLCSIRTC